MPPVRLNRLWRSLEEVPGPATDRRDWAERLGNEWPIVAGLFRSTGKYARKIDCPYPDGDGCPRRIVQHTSGRLVAVCADHPQRCETVELAPAEIAILEFDASKLGRVLRHVLDLGEPGSKSQGTMRRVGTLEAGADGTVAVVLAVPHGPTPVAWSDLPALQLGEVGGLLLTPTRASTPSLPDGWHHLPIAKLLGHDGDWAALPEARTLLDAAAAACRKPVFKNYEGWLLPPGARWEELTLEFVETQVIKALFRKETRKIEPFQLGMSSKKSVHPTVQWTLLRAFAEVRGELSWRSEHAGVGIKKQKQALNGKLKAAFGLRDEPIVWDARAKLYRTKFMVRVKSLRDAGQAQRR